MPAPKNPFKAAIHAGEMQIGCWLGLAEHYLAEISGSTGFDWVVVDAEHAPNDLRSVVAQLQILDGLPSHAVVRPPIGETWLIKQYLEAGAQTLLVPMVESAGKPAGILTTDKTLQTDCVKIGARFIATEIAVTLFCQRHAPRRRRCGRALAHIKDLRSNAVSAACAGRMFLPASINRLPII